VIGLVESVQEIGCTQRECRRNDVPIGRGMREGGRQIGRHDARNQECQPKRKLCCMSRGRKASAGSRKRNSGQIYRVATIPQAMKLNAILTKKQSCDSMNSSLLKFQPLIAGGRRSGLLVD